MRKILRRLITVVLPLMCLVANAASELQNYVQQCQNELQFNASDVPAVDCHNGVLFAGGSVGPVNDFVGYLRITDSVDLVFACRWLNDQDTDLQYRDKTAASIELLIHNRQNGSTCFFNAKNSHYVPDPNDDIPNGRRAVATAIVSPTNFGGTHPNADDYWLQPSELNAKRVEATALKDQAPAPDMKESIRCVGCHVAGPYIASQRIGPKLADFGLLNNGHDTIVDMKAPNHYHAVGSNPYSYPYDPNAKKFENWDNIIYNNFIDQYINGSSVNTPDGKPDQDCSGACHSIGLKSTVGQLNNAGIVLIPSLHFSIDNASDFMAPEYDSAYRAVNLDTPTNADGAEYETLVGLGIQYPQFYCSNPVSLEAHVVKNGDLSSTGTDSGGGNRIFSTTEMSLIPNKLRAFNLRDGLVCVNADQNGGTCKDYQTAYFCNGTWTDFQNHTPNSTGDNESRSGFTGLCSNPGAIQGRYNKGTAGSPDWVTFDGPNDRLAQFNNKGLICVNADQGAGQTCSNYVVRFICPTNSAPLATPSFKSIWSGAMITATAQQTDAETRGQPDNSSWNSQDWVIESIRGTVNVRIRNVWNGKYLNVQNQNESAKIVTYDLNTSWTSMQWTIEPIANSNDVRIKNVWTGKYLTLVDTSNYSAILSQSLNTSWASQRWLLQ
ncbi:MAG TPA: hypothetical protein VHL14_11305 [Steroidobacteraceae bacterium]|nr:hypothetical protein [Steroidobacteraceae bacterium]